MDHARRTADEALTEALPLKGRRVIDVGSGDGAIARFMTRQGATVIGIECGPAQLERAHAATPAGNERYIDAVGQDLPLPDQSADIVTFINSLHHVPVEAQGKALKEAARVLTDGGTLYIAEPLAAGPQFELMRVIDDETDVRAAAYGEIGRAGQYGLEAVSEVVHIQPRKVESFAALRDNSIAIDPGRATRFKLLERELLEGFDKLATKLPDGQYELVQPVRVNILRRRAR